MYHGYMLSFILAITLFSIPAVQSIAAIEKGSSKANLDVKDLAEGMYIVTVLAETGYVLRQKVVVIHTQ